MVPNFPGLFSLVNQHIHSIHTIGSHGFSGPDEFSLSRVVYQVEQKVFRGDPGDKGLMERVAATRVLADGGGINQ